MVSRALVWFFFRKPLPGTYVRSHFLGGLCEAGLCGCQSAERAWAPLAGVRADREGGQSSPGETSVETSTAPHGSTWALASLALNRMTSAGLTEVTSCPGSAAKGGHGAAVRMRARV